MGKKEAYAKRVQAQLDEWDADIKKLKARSDRAEANVRLEYHKQIDTLQKKQKEAGRKLSELRDASDDAWEDFKEGLEEAKNSLGSALKSAAARFR